MWHGLNGLELSLMNWLVSPIEGAFMDLLMSFFLFLARGSLVWILLTVLLFFDKRYRRTGYLTSAGLAIALLLSFVILKPILARTRPFLLLEGYSLIFPMPETYSFPSSQVTVAFAYVVMTWKSVKSLRIPVLTIASLVSLSKIYVYFNYFSDVVAGVFLGVFCGWFAVKLFEKYTVVRPELPER
ncbi:MAG TPA: phosphatase PAP2 family protein [Mesotoga infera]|jgi:undecaprenyl-diphosphatase|nr:phosphatase PAP2 family protein [Mesotoga sp.]NLI05591.1 phosphatase PAP2 family protein [Thermotogaceae bacterium]HNR80766.1 phosphatase PAP2 family protein [Mesotoga infera]HOI34325.1 phosphatase PAP2 family protein [Mesotoga infera]HON27255.1 phosphatase PAP2 family protein [Mesotoga infera]